LIFLPLYLIHPSVVWLIAGQSLALSIAAWPIFESAKHLFKERKLALAWAAIYLFNPFIINAANWDFHPITISVPFISLGLLAVFKNNYKLLIFSTVFILLCKEHLGIMIAGFGVLWWIKNKNWKQSITLILIGLSHFYIVMKIIMPLFSPTGQHLMINEGSDFGRYSWLGSSIEEVIWFILSEPIFVLKTIFIKFDGLFYLFLLLFPLLGSPLLNILLIIPGFGDLAANMMAEITLPRSIISYHSASLIPVLVIAGMEGITKIVKIFKKISLNKIIKIILFTSIISGYFLSSTGLPGALNFWKPNNFINLPDQRVNEIEEIIGKKSSISVQANVGPHFSQRKEIYTYPNKISDVDAIILKLESPTKNINNYFDNEKKKRQFSLRMLDSHLQMDRIQYLDSIEKLLDDEKFSIIYWDNPWLVLKKGKKNSIDIERIKKIVQMLRQEW